MLDVAAVVAALALGDGEEEVLARAGALDVEEVRALACGDALRVDLLLVLARTAVVAAARAAAASAASAAAVAAACAAAATGVAAATAAAVAAARAATTAVAAATAAAVAATTAVAATAAAVAAAAVAATAAAAAAAIAAAAVAAARAATAAAAAAAAVSAAVTAATVSAAVTAALVVIVAHLKPGRKEERTPATPAAGTYHTQYANTAPILQLARATRPPKQARAVCLTRLRRAAEVPGRRRAASGASTPPHRPASC